MEYKLISSYQDTSSLNKRIGPMLYCNTSLWSKGLQVTSIGGVKKGNVGRGPFELKKSKRKSLWSFHNQQHHCRDSKRILQYWNRRRPHSRHVHPSISNAIALFAGWSLQDYQLYLRHNFPVCSLSKKQRR
jgi:hypothetical protein